MRFKRSDDRPTRDEEPSKEEAVDPSSAASQTVSGVGRRPGSLKRRRDKNDDAVPSSMVSGRRRLEGSGTEAHFKSVKVKGKAADLDTVGVTLRGQKFGIVSYNANGLTNQADLLRLLGAEGHGWIGVQETHEDYDKPTLLLVIMCSRPAILENQKGARVCIRSTEVLSRGFMLDGREAPCGAERLSLSRRTNQG